MEQRVYANYAAGAPLRPAAKQAMETVFAMGVGNPSDPGREGRAARRVLEESRHTIASLLQVEPGDIFFTSGATESCNLALLGMRPAAGHRTLALSALEHSAVRAPAKTWPHPVVLPATPQGVVDPAAAETLLNETIFLCSVMTVSHELGTRQPLTGIARLCQQAGIFLHTDATQAVGRLPLYPAKWGVSLLSFSAHKFGGPQGAGILYRKQGVPLAPVMHGGDQEQGLRPGTENVAAAAGMAAALAEALAHQADENERLSLLTEKLRDTLLAVPGAAENGGDIPRVPGFLSLRFQGVRGPDLAAMLDVQGITIGTGSACEAAAGRPSPVLRAMGLSEQEAAESVRLSLGYRTTESDIDRLCQRIPETVSRLRALSGSR